MKTSVIGFPRIGAHRELKFASEKYFAKTISQEELEQAAKQIRLDGWKKQAEAGISFISSNDFSFYDGMLDTAFMLGAIPARYKSLCLSKLAYNVLHLNTFHCFQNRLAYFGCMFKHLVETCKNSVKYLRNVRVIAC